MATAAPSPRSSSPIIIPRIPHQSPLPSPRRSLTPENAPLDTRSKRILERSNANKYIVIDSVPAGEGGIPSARRAESPGSDSESLRSDSDGDRLWGWTWRTRINGYPHEAQGDVAEDDTSSRSGRGDGRRGGGREGDGGSLAAEVVVVGVRFTFNEAGNEWAVTPGGWDVVEYAMDKILKSGDFLVVVAVNQQQGPNLRTSVSQELKYLLAEAALLQIHVTIQATSAPRPRYAIKSEAEDAKATMVLVGGDGGAMDGRSAPSADHSTAVEFLASHLPPSCSVLQISGKKVVDRRQGTLAMPSPSSTSRRASSDGVLGWGGRRSPPRRNSSPLQGKGPGEGGERVASRTSGTNRIWFWRGGGGGKGGGEGGGGGWIFRFRSISGSGSVVSGKTVSPLRGGGEGGGSLSSPPPVQAGVDWKSLFGAEEDSFRWEEIERFTWGFTKQLGGGGCGDVYLGEWVEEREGLVVRQAIAVKVLARGDFSEKREDDAQRLEMLQELSIIQKLNHRNLVRLLGFCLEGDHCCLVLEYLDNGSLDQRLTDPLKPVLTWPQRVAIAKGAAEGYAYLHHYLATPIVHRDVKSANILLDRNLNAQVADFGIAKLLPDNRTTEVTKILGTDGYLEPEYRDTRTISTGIDVYAYGIILLELITGKKPILERDGRIVHLKVWAKIMIEDGRFLEIVDLRLGDYLGPHANQIKILSKIAYCCTAEERKDRPNMKQVLRWLHKPVFDEFQ